jgi:hypothetical protein
MQQYKIEVTYTRLDNEGSTITKTMPFVITSSTLEEARISVQEIATNYVSKVNGTIVSII